MEYTGWKGKLAQFILAVVNKAYEERFKNYEERFLVLEENLRNNNSSISSMTSNLDDINERLNALESNVRNNNEVLNLLTPSLDDINERFNVLESNIRNNNEVLRLITPSLNDITGRLNVLESNARNNNNILDLLMPRLEDFNERLNVLEENVRGNNSAIFKISKGKNDDIWEAKFEAIKNSVNKLRESSLTICNRPQETNEIKSVIVDGTNKTSYGQIDYFSFENYFRGSEELIKKRQEIYLPYFTGCQNVLDLGCGRGEFLELLKENNIDAVGVDFYDEFAIYSRNKGFNVITGDAIAELANFSGSVGGIFAGQLVEHLTTNQIVELCKLAYEKLDEGKYFIMETPNPMSLAIYTHAFYLDPSHQKPVHPLTLKYLTEKAGFEDVQIIFTEESKLSEEAIPKLQGENISNLEEFNNSMQRVSEYLFGSQDYAIIARR